MLQRKQTLYLTISLLLIGSMVFLPLGEIASLDVIYNFGIKGVEKSGGDTIYNGWPLIMLVFIILAVNIFVIAKYKNRILQMRAAFVNIVLMIGLVLISWYFISASLKQIGNGVYSFKIALSFPIVSVILNYLAIRAIGRDEALVRSIDRIR